MNTQSYFGTDIAATESSPQVYEFRMPLRLGSRNNVSFTLVNDLRSDDNAGGEWRRRKPFWLAKQNNPQPLPDLYAPQIFLDWIEIEGPVFDTWPPKSHSTIFFKGNGAKEDLSYAREIVEKFLPRAYRRPVAAEDIDPIFNLVAGQMESGESFTTAIKTGIQAILCSPDFLYIVEDQKGELSSHQLATRLSYLLWSSVPDAELTALADSEKINDPAVLTAQVKRMLADPKAERFVDQFAGQWLQLSRVGQFKPDPKLFPEWSKTLETAMAEETKAFFREILQNDLNVLNFLDSDWAMLNETVARFYGIPGIVGNDFRNVPLKPEYHRGGVLTQGSILSLTSDGTRTRPVHRGVWVMESIFAKTPQPPPPNVPEIEPNVPGSAQLSVRERLSKHSDLLSCASCHKKIDPLGLAFEGYDAIGQWRSTDAGKPVDATGELPGGREFANAQEFKELLMKDEDQFLKALCHKIFIYGLGREIEFSDREDLAALQKSLEENPTLSNLIATLVVSEPFRTK